MNRSISPSGHPWIINKMRTNEKYKIDREMLDTEHLKIKILHSAKEFNIDFFMMSYFFEKRLDKQMKIDDCTITYLCPFLHENKICKVLQNQSTKYALILYNVTAKRIRDIFSLLSQNMTTDCF